MTSTPVKNEDGIIIGYIEDDTYQIRYRSLSYGVVSYYDKQSNIYYRYKQIPGRPMVTPHGDMGEFDLRYWGR